MSTKPPSGKASTSGLWMTPGAMLAVLLPLPSNTAMRSSGVPSPSDPKSTVKAKPPPVSGVTMVSSTRRVPTS